MSTSTFVETSDGTSVSIKTQSSPGTHPLRDIKCISYNGSYWIAGGTSSIKTSSFYTYQQVIALLNQSKQQETTANYFKRGIDETDDVSVKEARNESYIFYRTQSQLLLSQAKSTFKRLQTLNFPQTLINQGTLHTLAISRDGYSWKLIDSNPFNAVTTVTNNSVNTYLTNQTTVPPSVNGVAWNGNLWIAVGQNGNYLQWNGSSFTSSSLNYSIFNTSYQAIPPYRIATSTDAISWTGRKISNGDYFEIMNGVTSSSTLSIIFGRFQKTGEFPYINRTIIKSSDGISWSVPLDNYPNINIARCAAYNGSVWVVAGGDESGISNSYSLSTSSDGGDTWTSRVRLWNDFGLGDNPSMYGVAWNGTSWLAIGYNDTQGFILKSTDGITWTNTNGFPKFKTVVYDGTNWILGGQKIYKSSNGTTWEEVTTLANGKTVNAISTPIVLPLLGGTITTVNSLLLGIQGTSYNALRSSDNSTWRIQKADSSTITAYSRIVELYAAVWTGTKWIAVGNSHNDSPYVKNNILKSTNGFDWENFETQSNNYLKDLFYRKGRAIAYNGTMLVAVGEEGSKIITSTNQGESWTIRTSGLITCKCVAWNGTRWVVGGDGGIETSTNGTSWTSATICPLSSVNSVAWNGYLWVAVGTGTKHSIALSTNGTHWYSANMKLNPFTVGNSIAWNRDMWVALGKGNNTIATSVDGYTWTGLGSDVFTVSGKIIAWNGTNWIASGIGAYNFATSTNGTSWTRSNLELSSINGFVTKLISLPYTDASAQPIINQITPIVTLINNLVAQTIDEAAELVFRTNSKNSIAGYRIRVLYWQSKITEQYTPLVGNINALTNLPFVVFETEFPIEYSYVSGCYHKLNESVTLINKLYQDIFDSSKSPESVARDIAIAEALITDLNTNIVDFYNNARFLYKKLLQAKYDFFITNADTLTTINSYGYSNTNKNAILAVYNSGKDTFDTNKAVADALYNTSYASVTYSVNIPNSSLIGVSLASVLNNITSNAVTLNITVDYPISAVLYYSFKQNKTYKTEADALVTSTLATATNWASVLNSTVPTTTINDAFNTLYNKYFYITTFPYYYTHNTFSQGYVFATDKAIRYFKIVSEDYSHPSAYITQLTTLYQTLKTLIDSVETTRITALNYARSKRTTVVQPKVDEFFTTTKAVYTAALGIDTLISTITTTTYFNNSIFVKSKKFAELVYVGSKVYPTLYPFIRAIKLADAEAEDDGCVAPATGWGGTLNGLSVGQTGQQGRSGWDKFNETYFTRQRLANFIRTNSFQEKVRYTLDGVSLVSGVYWKEFLDFTNTLTYVKLQQYIDDLESAISGLNSNNSFDETNITNIANQDVINIQAQVIPTATTYLQNILLSVTTNIPTQTDLTDFGDVTYSGSDTFQTMVNTINTNKATLVTTVNTSLTGKTNSQILALIETAILNKSTINAVQRSTAYMTITKGIPVYRALYAKTVNFVEQAEDAGERWRVMKENAVYDAPFPIIELTEEDAVGDPFIVSIDPTNTNYWTPRTYTVFKKVDTGEIVECTFNSQTNKIQTLPELNPSDFQPYSRLQKYVARENVSFNGKVYFCKKDNTDYSGASKGIRGVLPTDQVRWEDRLYPMAILNGRYVDTNPIHLPSLRLSDYNEYSSTTIYLHDTYVTSNSKIYRCSINNTNSRKIQQINPTNTSFWKKVVYPIVSYNGAQVEVSPTNFPILNLANIQEYSSDKIYYKYSIVKFTGSYKYNNSELFSPDITRIYELQEDIIDSSNVTGSINDPPIKNDSSGVPRLNSNWNIIQYPVVEYDGQRLESNSSVLSQLNPSNYQDYLSSTYFFNGDYTTYNGEVYICTVLNISSITNVPVTNTHYWTEVSYPVVTYLGQDFEACPGRFTLLNASDYEEYSPTKTYYVDDMVSYSGKVYAVTNDSPYGVAIINIPPTVENHWVVQKYPTVLVDDDEYEVDADPAYGRFKQLNEKEYHKYHKNFLYYVGDYVSFNGTVYQCTNVTTPVMTTIKVSGISPTNSDYWEAYILDLLDYDVSEWSYLKTYVKGSYVIYEGKIYLCETEHTYKTPGRSDIYWNYVDNYFSLGLPQIYDSEHEYSIGNVVAYRELTDNIITETYQLNFYKCYRSQPNSPIKYDYDKLYTTTTVGVSGFNNRVRFEGSWIKDGVPRQGDPENDPFALSRFPSKLRRKVAMNVELPYKEIAYIALEGLSIIDAFSSSRTSNYITDPLYPSQTWTVLTETPTPNSHNFTLLRIKPTNASTLFTALRNRVVSVINTFNTSETQLPYRKLIISVYGEVITFLQKCLTFVKQATNRINTMKTQYYNSPYIQKLIFENPYQFMNPVAFTSTPPKKLFKDLGIGSDEGNITEAARQIYNDRVEQYETLIEQISNTVLKAKRIIGYGLLFNMSTNKRKMGARLVCDIPYISYTANEYSLARLSGVRDLPFMTIDTPIADADILYPTPESGTLENPPEDGIVYLINQIMIESIKPPEYVLGTNYLLEALTYETQNKALLVLGSIAKGIVGITTAVFTDYVDPLSGVLGLIGLADLYLTNGRLGTSAWPSVKWPTYRDLTGSIVMFNQAVQYERNQNAIALIGDEEDEDARIHTVGSWIYEIGAYILRIQDDISTVALYVREEAKWVSNGRRMISETSIALPLAPPPDYIAPPKPQAPTLKSQQCLDALKRELTEVRSAQKALVDELDMLVKKRPYKSVPIYQNMKETYEQIVKIPAKDLQLPDAVDVDQSKPKKAPKGQAIGPMDDAAQSMRTGGGKIKGQGAPQPYLPRIAPPALPASPPVRQAKMQEIRITRERNIAVQVATKEKYLMDKVKFEGLVASIEDLSLKESGIVRSITDANIENFAAAIDNDVSLKFHEGNVRKWEAEVEKGFKSYADAKYRYETSVNNYKRSRSVNPSAGQIVQSNRAILTQVETSLVGNVETLRVYETTFVREFLTNQNILNILATMYPNSIVSRLNDIVNFSVNLNTKFERSVRNMLNGITKIVMANRAVKYIMRIKPHLAPFIRSFRLFKKSKKFKYAGIVLGIGLEAIGSVFTALDNGSFDSDPVLGEDPAVSESRQVSNPIAELLQQGAENIWGGPPVSNE